ncbi:MAG: HDOD domain-containing protein [Gammaproteobacteria bacterium]|nr:HDOD domain-containing protein [Gammaproteobacteria bacterium]MBU1645203.1 HDOD domain-containing protein [Gammaproteobacteria bacterium]MBU1973440.1 HDOD domain-containing protein [Gammaproteobacteria bacterium]
MSKYLLRREPVLNRQKAIIATRLISHAASAAEAAADFKHLADVWPDARTVLISLAETIPDTGLLDWQFPENVMVELPAARLAEPSVQALMQQLAASRVPICLDGYQPGMSLPAAQFRFILADAATHPRLDNAPGLMLARRLASLQEFDDAMDHGYSGACGWFFLKGMPVAGKLNASHGQIVRVLNLVRKNADIKDIEAALKQDVTLSFKLLRYINSAGFGLATQIESFKHAVTLLGYDKLNKWLSLLLVTASKDAAAPALMQTAIARGRLMEILGAAAFDKSQTDNLFITGAFSLLDVLLGTRMDAVLEQMTLPDSISSALLRQEGPFGPWLDLALASESGDAAALAAKADVLGLAPETLNHAQIEALVFADALQFN